MQLYQCLKSIPAYNSYYMLLLYFPSWGHSLHYTPSGYAQMHPEYFHFRTSSFFQNHAFLCNFTRASLRTNIVASMLTTIQKTPKITYFRTKTIAKPLLSMPCRVLIIINPIQTQSYQCLYPL